MNRSPISGGSKGALSLPGAVIIAAALIAVAMIWINRPTGDKASNTPDNNEPAGAKTGIPAVIGADHILGNPAAPIKFIEYSDLSCPYCKEFNPTMVHIMDDYGSTGKVAWVYRHFPLFKEVDGVVPHPNSEMQAEALECAGQLGGNSGFFSFEKNWFSTFPDDGAGRSATEDRNEIKRTAADAGLDAPSFSECLLSGRFRQKIEQAYSDGLKTGITGTPFTIMVTPAGNQIPLSGAQPYANLKKAIDTLISTIPTNQK